MSRYIGEENLLEHLQDKPVPEEPLSEQPLPEAAVGEEFLTEEPGRLRFSVEQLLIDQLVVGGRQLDEVTLGLTEEGERWRKLRRETLDI